LFGVAVNKLANAEVGAFNLVGVYELAKATGAITAGAKVYWDNSAKNVTTTASGNSLIGAATVAALSGDATVIVRLDGTTI
jgi:predicted RecA/RadA family phage recombinase